jgi:hypothetical protein
MELQQNSQVTQETTEALIRESQLAKGREILSGSGAMGPQLGGLGGSPIPVLTQMQMRAMQILREHLVDPEGALLKCLESEIQSQAELFAELQKEHFRSVSTGWDEQLVGILKRFLKSIVEDPEQLRTWTYKADVEWGRIYQERPYFEQQGRSHSEDPYTLVSVRKQILTCLGHLELLGLS